VQGSQFSLKDVEVITATVDLDDVVSFRAATVSRSQQVRRAMEIKRMMFCCEVVHF
jgi:hypothetical protein